MLREEAPLLATATADVVLDELVDDVGGLGPLEPLLADATITEIMVNGGDRVFVERAGRIEAVGCAIDAATIVRIVERVIAPLGLRLDRASPMVDARLADGSRLHAVLPPLAPDGPCLSIRRFGARSVPLAAFGVEPEVSGLLDTLVASGWNIVVSGATSSGKTTCCNALAQAIDPAERIVTIEETAELRLEQPHVVRLEARPANAEGAGAVGVRELVRSALRMRPDRIVVGEVRGGEALDMLQACNTGHDGSLSTVHANSPDDALARIETLALCADVPLPLPAVRASARLRDRCDRAGPARSRRPARDRVRSPRSTRGEAPEPAASSTGSTAGSSRWHLRRARPGARRSTSTGNGSRAPRDGRPGLRADGVGSRTWRAGTRFRTACAAVPTASARQVPAGLGRRMVGALDAAALDVSASARSRRGRGR